MNSRIHILPDTVVNKIAAGEVVERPSSVVKELVENALDAGATSVEIVLISGGRDLIEVTDNGSGMSAEESHLALTRHATSKISALEDLHSLRSFGFRGEALPSIASVSRLTLETNDGSSAEGISIVVQGGEIKREEPIARRQGTTVRVEHLFANVPARRKFLKTAQTEHRHAVRTIVDASLTSLNVRFRLENDRRESFELRAGQSLQERAEMVLGRKATTGSILMTAEIENLRIYGLLGTPSTARKSASAVHFFVNGRPISHRGLSYALYTGYGELLGEGRYPLACLLLDIAPDRVDINVHPAKREVRFEDEGRVKDLIATSVRETLSRELGAKPLNLDRRAGGSGAGRQTAVATHTGRIGEGDLPWRDGGLFSMTSEEAKSAAEELFRVHMEEEPAIGPVDAGVVEMPVVEENPMIWQIHDRYLIAPIKGGLLVVDQHAAHERILYERALAQLSGQPASRQQLLFPMVLELSVDQAALVEEFGPLLERVGFDVRPFGGNTVALHAVPPLLERAGKEEEIFLALLDDMVEGGARGSGVQEKIAASLACRAAIMFGQRLDGRERRSLVDQLFACSQPQVCPHGRPTHLVLSLEELDSRFDR